jgi:hypothetical protein
LGAGTTTRYIEIDYATTSSTGLINAENDLITDAELITYFNRYEYARLDRINIKIPPNAGNGEIKFLARWSDATIISSELENSDSAKRVAIHTVKYQTVTYLPPHITNTRWIDLGTSKSISTIIMDEFNSTDQFYYKSSSQDYAINLPFHVAVSSNTASINLKFCFKFTFRGEKYDQKLSKMIVMYYKDKNFRDTVDKQVTNKELEVLKPQAEEDPWEADPEEDELEPDELDVIRGEIIKDKKKEDKKVEEKKKKKKE